MRGSRGGSGVALPAPPTTSRELAITRVFDAPRALVFRAWTEPEHLLRWCAPHGFTGLLCENDLRRGGAWRHCTLSPDGVAYCVGGVYREVERDGRLAFTHAWRNEDGRSGHETLVSVTLSASGTRTVLDFRQRLFRSAESRDSHRGAWSECFDRLHDHLRGPA